MESKILNLDDGVARLNITALKNTDEETSSFISDTVLYNNNNYSHDGFISKPGYVFRGWYRDQNWSMECSFNDQDYIYLETNTTIYAKWDEIKQIELDWSNYYPYNERTTIINYVDTTDLNESVTLPKLSSEGGDITRAGFESLTWEFDDNTVEKTADLYNLNPNNAVLKVKAVWTLKDPTISYLTQVDSTSYAGSNLTFDFDEGQTIHFISTFTHESSNVSLRYVWKKISDTGVETTLSTSTTNNSDTFNYSLRNYSDSGLYEFEVFATCNTGETSSTSQRYRKYR